MNRLMHTVRNQVLRKKRVRAVISGSAERPRLSVHLSNRHVTAQLIDDTAHQTLAYVATTSSKGASGSMKERAHWVGAEIAKKAKAAKIKRVVFDRGGHLYHGRVQALAEAARKEGLEF